MKSVLTIVNESSELEMYQICSFLALTHHCAPPGLIKSLEDTYGCHFGLISSGNDLVVHVSDDEVVKKMCDF